MNENDNLPDLGPPNDIPNKPSRKPTSKSQVTPPPKDNPKTQNTKPQKTTTSKANTQFSEAASSEVGKIILDQKVVAQPPTPPQPKYSNIQVPPIKMIPKKYLLIAAGILAFLVVGTGAVLGLNKLLFGPTSLHFVPDDAEFYLGISVRNHPQVQKLKELTEKFPGGEKISESPTNFTRELLGTPKDPFEDIVRLAKEEVFLAKVSENQDTRQRGGALAALLNVVDLDSPKIADEKLNNFKEDKQIYTTLTQTFEEEEIIKIDLKERGKSSQQYPLGGLPLSLTLPYSKGVFASSIDKFIVSSENIDDIKKSISLSKKASLLGSLPQSDLKNILSDKEHKKIEKYFPDEYLVKFYQQKPLEPFSGMIPSTAISQSFLLGYDSLSKIEGKNFIEVNRGLIITAHDDGVRMSSVQLDWRTPDNDLSNPYKISDSLANKLPQTYSGLHPFAFAETKNLENLVEDQKKILTEVVEQSDNRNQRQAFEKAIKAFDDYNSELRKTFGVDPEKDIFSWMKGQTATLFMAGGKNKSPESIIVAQISDREKARESITKIKIPNYQAESQQRLAKSRDRTRVSNLTSLAKYLDKYFDANGKYPSKLADLVPSYIYSQSSLKYYNRDPKSKKEYKYSLGSGQKSFALEANLEDGRKFTVTDKNKLGTYSGKAKKVEIKPIAAKESEYKETTIYTWPIYNTGGIKYEMYAAITKEKAILLFGDSSKSLEDIIDFEQKPTPPLASSESWKKQFGEVSGDVGGLVYIEPVRLFGLWEYYKSLYSSTISSLSFEESDIEVVLKAYLKTLKSIGTVVSKEKPVFTTKTFVQIEEIPSEEKSKADDALFRLLDQNKKSGFPVLGVSKISLSESLRNLRGLILP